MLKQKMVNEGMSGPMAPFSVFQIAAREATLDNKAENFFC